MKAKWVGLWVVSVIVAVMIGYAWHRSPAVKTLPPDIEADMPGVATANALFAAAAARGTWTDADAQAFRRISLSPQSEVRMRDTLLRKCASGEIKLAVSGPPF